MYGFVGRLTKDKGIYELLEAFEKISSTKENTYLLMIGRCETYDSALDEAAKNRRIIFTGNVGDPEKYYASMDAFILPSYREGMANSIIEAEAMGVPVIVTDIPGTVDAMGVNITGLTVKKADVESLKDAMNTIYENDELRERFASVSRNFVKEKFEKKELISHIIKDRKRLLGIEK